MSSYTNKESVLLQEIDVDLLISTKIFLTKTAKIYELKEKASKEFKQYGHGHFEYFIVDHQIHEEEDLNPIESLGSYRTNKILLKPTPSYKDQYEEYRKTLDGEGKFKFLIVI